MEHKMLWGALAVGGAGWLCLLLLASRGPQRSSLVAAPHQKQASSFVWLALVIPILVWLATTPTKAPFSAGQGWGRGFLLGGLLSFLSVFVVSRSQNTARSGRYLAMASLFGALIVACVPLLLMRHAVIEALLGASLGWGVVALVWLFSSQLQATPTTTGSSSSLALGLLNGSAFVTTLCSAAALGVYRDFVVSDVARGTYPAVAVVLAASIALALLFGMLMSEVGGGAKSASPSPRLFQVITALLCLIVPLGLGFLLATRMLDDLKVVYCLGVGGVLSLLGWFLLWDASQRQEGSSSVPTTIPPVALIVALCAFMLAYSFLQGFGVGLMLLAAWPVSLLLLFSLDETGARAQLRFDVAQAASLLAAFLAVLLVSRVFATRFRADLRGVGLVDQFALFGFLVGALVPTWLASLWFNSKEPRAHSIASLLQLVSIGVLSLLLPSAMLAIWGVKVVPAFLAGLALAVAGWNSTGQGSPRICAVAVLAQALSLVVTQWTIRFLPLADLSRAQRMHFLLWGLGGAVLLILLVDLSARLLIWLGGRNQTTANKTSAGVSQ